MRLYSLRYPIDNDDTYNTSVSSTPDNGMIFNLRVRCRGKVHKFEIHKVINILIMSHYIINPVFIE